MAEPHDIWAVVPMKATTQSKQRLATVLPQEARQRLALAMFTDVMTALAGVSGFAGILVVTTDPSVIAIANRFKALVICDDAGSGHTAAVTAGVRHLVQESHAGMLTIPGDIPLVTSDEIETLLREHPLAPSLSIVPAHDGRGSNAMLLTPPDAMPLQFGNDSFLPHLATARGRGLEICEHALPGIALDIDTPQDLAAFLHVERDKQTAALLATLKISGFPPPRE